ncbi:hypothetical protein ASPWEDRAFT_100809 [Aspergillus wentii DTO 134E9]|uniref:Tyrosinase copper-binding domain-containing protein n=1 Tax=Aspergillus wentii DTO 134E9 TaxID=1073089 RepID=A0A1L9S434_ASPWE|nr:uncharacterized protein ASPWEDRAFT_100809 [Aspergillus wentii DTO 134E9]KAI9930255.1 hypothetical protein MW887_012068 [Aspergillus wentii]OJJ41932.1 hypothetical protein ASPWEDRAFT_100809 [Aspergillus wentii DTO 134E9]
MVTGPESEPQPQSDQDPTLIAELLQPICKTPSQRQEWRQLNATEKTGYIDAVKCLHSQPSARHPYGQLSDDFPWAYRSNAHFASDAAPFLPWHRYFIHVYETALKESCGYTGHLPYWDWTLDWEDPAKSAIWDPETGFGGDGASNNMKIGSCVDSGPFSDYQILYSDLAIKPHCLSRGFGRHNESGVFEGKWFSPEVVKQISLEHNFFNFSMALKAGPYNNMSNQVGGDFLSFDAPNDPVSFLHYAQLDRLWWMWQKDHPQNSTEYNGPKNGDSNAMASLLDVLPMYGLSRDTPVSDVIDTQSGLLCYKY